MGQGRPVSRRELVAAGIVVLAAWVAYATTIDNYFVQDDFGVVALLSQKPASYFPRWFVSTWMDHIWGYTPDEIRPFPAVTYQLAAWWGPTSTVANHVFNIAFHAANGVLVLAIARVVAGLGVPGATVAALVFVLLPVQSESVAWITGRVDSMPAFFYLASFLAWARWRRGGAWSAYAWSLGLFFVALFTKQNTITMVPALLLFDVIFHPSVARFSKPRAFRRAVVAYLPFVALTIGYLALRYALFGAIAREDRLSADSTGYFLTLVGRHLHRLVLGSLDIKLPLTAVLLAGVAVVTAAAWASALDRARAVRALLYFAVIWTALGLAPVAVAGYESPRHVYLASVGWAVALGVAFEVLWSINPARIWRPMASVAAAAVLAAYAVRLAEDVRTWNTRAAVSHLAVVDLEREILAMPEGTLVIAGAPTRSWEWALPFVAQPPYTRADMTTRARMITPWLLHCCRHEWEGYTRRTLDAWRSAGSPPVIALYWDEKTGELSKLTDREEPYLRSLMTTLLGTDGYLSLNEGIMDMLTDLVAPHVSPRGAHEGTTTHTAPGIRPSERDRY